MKKRPPIPNNEIPQINTDVRDQEQIKHLSHNNCLSTEDISTNTVDIIISNDIDQYNKLTNILISNGFEVNIIPVKLYSKYTYCNKIRIIANKIDTSL